MRPGRRALVGALAALCVLAPELAYWAGARAAAVPAPGGSCGVLVLGFPPRADGSPHPMQRRRVETGVWALERAGCRLMVLSGGNPHSSRVEAEVMAELAREAGVPAEKLASEGSSRNTWENVSHTLPLLAGFETVYLVSDSLHAHRARRYFCRQAPALCARARPVGRYRPGDLYLLKWLGLLHEAGAFVRDALAGN